MAQPQGGEAYPGAGYQTNPYQQHVQSAQQPQQQPQQGPYAPQQQYAMMAPPGAQAMTVVPQQQQLQYAPQYGAPQYGGAPQYPGAPQYAGAPSYGGPMMMPMSMGSPTVAAPAFVQQTVLVQRVVTPDLISTVAALKGIYVVQKVNLMEVLTGCESRSQFFASGWDPVAGAVDPRSGRADEQLFRFKEDSNCCVRQILMSARPYRMAMFPFSPSILTFRGPGGDPFEHPDALIIERPFRCTILCAWRSVFRVRHATLGYIGEVYNPFRLLSREVIVRAPSHGGALGIVAEAVKALPQGDWYVVKATICQPGMLCFLPCGECARVRFNIYRADDAARATPVGSFERIWAGCVKQLMTDSDNYTMAFPPDAHPLQKAVLAVVATCVDMLLWEHKDNDRNNNGGGLIGAVLSSF